MKLVNSVVLKDHYDVIVVGAGLGGMTTASLLAKRGLSVLMIDHQDKPGGSCTSFRRAGVTYDVGTAMLYGFGENGFKPFRFLMNELEEPVEIIAHKTLARMTFEGRVITFWPDIEQFLRELDQIFPGEEEGLRAFYRDLYTIYENIVIKNEVIVPPSEFSSRQGLRSLKSGIFETLRDVRLLSTSTRSLLERYFKSPEIINFFDKLCSAYCYCTAAETPAILAATMFLDNHIGGVYYPAGGAQMLPNKIEKAFEQFGGQVLYRTLVDEILIRRGRAYGVRLSSGDEIYANRVVANATVWNIYGKLVRPENIKPERLAWACGLEPTFPSMTLYMLVDRSALPEDVLPWEVFIENRAEIDSSDLTLYINALVDETLCPPGKLVITAIAPNLEKWPAPGSAEYHSQAYRDHKHVQAQKMLDQIEQHFPGFCSCIDTLIVGTPTTIERYLLKNWGAVGGPKNKIGQEMLKRLHARSEWKNLYICGDSTVMATGAPAAVVSGVGAANVILRDMRLHDYDTRPFAQQMVKFVDTPYRRPTVEPGVPIDKSNAWLFAAQCQGCQNSSCMRECPAGIDIPGVLRRVEARNYIGAARQLRQHSPFASLCGTACPAEKYCERRCYRAGITGQPVRIAEIMRWVGRVTGEYGWLYPEGEPQRRVAVLGSRLNGWSCAYYLALDGFEVHVFGQSNLPKVSEACACDEVENLMNMGIHYHAIPTPRQWRQNVLPELHQAVYISSGEWNAGTGPLFRIVERFYPLQDERLLSPAGLVAEGRRAAFAIAAKFPVKH